LQAASQNGGNRRVWGFVGEHEGKLIWFWRGYLSPGARLLHSAWRCPFPVRLSKALLALESFLHLHQPTLAPLLIAAALWAGAIVLSTSTLVPINNRIASLNTAAPAADVLYRVRILLLTLALLLVVDALAG